MFTLSKLTIPVLWDRKPVLHGWSPLGQLLTFHQDATLNNCLILFNYFSAM